MIHIIWIRFGPDANRKCAIYRKKGHFMFIRSERIDFLNRLFIDFQLVSMRGWAVIAFCLPTYIYLCPKVCRPRPVQVKVRVVLLEHQSFRTISRYVLRLSQWTLWWRSWALVRLIQEKVSHVFILFRESYCTVLSFACTRPLPKISNILRS